MKVLKQVKNKLVTCQIVKNEHFQFEIVIKLCGVTIITIKLNELFSVLRERIIEWNHLNDSESILEISLKD